jgi:hypothetical protein
MICIKIPAHGQSFSPPLSLVDVQGRKLDLEEEIRVAPAA